MTIRNPRKSINIAIEMAICSGWEVSESALQDGEVDLMLNRHEKRIDITYRISSTGYLTFRHATQTYTYYGDRYDTWKETWPLIGTDPYTHLDVLVRSGTVITRPGSHGATIYARNPDPLPETIEVTHSDESAHGWFCRDHNTDQSGLPTALFAEIAARLHLVDRHRIAHPLPPGTPVKHRGQQWARTATATVREARGPYPDGTYEYRVTCGQDFSRRLGPNNPETHTTTWSSQATIPADQAEEQHTKEKGRGE